MNRLFRTLIMSVVIAVFAAPLKADDDHERARRAFESGQIVGLNQILRRVHSTYPGKILEVELDERRGSNRGSPWVYTVKVLTPQGRVVDLRLDAKTMRIIEVRGRGAGKRRKHDREDEDSDD
jgi:uncharacterized membrane protein YkoI